MEFPSSLREYLSEIKGYIYLSAAIFSVSVVTGYLYAQFLPEKASEFFSTLQQVMAHRFGGMESGFMVLAIFVNNLIATSMMLVLGVFFGFLPSFGLVVNGIILGVVGYVVKKESVLLLFSIIPHGIFEIPVFLVSAAIGLRLGHQAVRKLFQGNEIRVLEELRRGVYFYVRWGVPFLLVAAFIEAFISIRIANLFR